MPFVWNEDFKRAIHGCREGTGYDLFRNDSGVPDCATLELVSANQNADRAIEWLKEGVEPPPN